MPSSSSWNETSLSRSPKSSSLWANGRSKGRERGSLIVHPRLAWSVLAGSGSFWPTICCGPGVSSSDIGMMQQKMSLPDTKFWPFFNNSFFLCKNRTQLKLQPIENWKTCYNRWRLPSPMAAQNQLIGRDWWSTSTTTETSMQGE